MNQYLTSLFSSIFIDIDHLENHYLTVDELDLLNNKLNSTRDFESDFYTDSLGSNLECLLLFLYKNKNLITSIMQGIGTEQDHIDLYTSPIISGNYDCFRFDLNKFNKTYESNNQLIKLYRIGRVGESLDSLGNSWSTNIEGLKAYYQASGLSENEIICRPVFSTTVVDSEVLFEGSKQEYELVLKPGFNHSGATILDTISKKMLFK
ncbi:hypothetical protein [Pseudoalteromonas sp. XMcav11-Q]|uniref:hypothetical protein n=1 Tax=Pseudoalteromonas sp. XMcav11-Q TaxID=3136665 RepID=UPI0032C489CC